MTAFDAIVKQIKTPEFYVPRDYKTVGGVWTVDTWVRDGVTVQLMDEGWTTRIISDTVAAMMSGTAKTPVFTVGSEADLEQLLQRLEQQ